MVTEFGHDARLINELLSHSRLRFLFTIVVIVPQTKLFYNHIDAPVCCQVAWTETATAKGDVFIASWSGQISCTSKYPFYNQKRKR